jgi:hypothetical protein
VKPRPTRSTPAGRAYLELRRLASQQGRPTAELLHLYALEGFLARLPTSPHAHRFALKGGLLLAAFNVRRPTRDVDLSAAALRNDPEVVGLAIQEVTAIEIDDGLEFDTAAGDAEVIRENDDYSGVRVTVPCRLASATVDFHVDVNVGDPIWPGPTEVTIPRLLGGDPLRVQGHPVTMVLAEKIVTAIQRGTANTRWRDFVDILALSRRHPVDAHELSGAIRTVAEHRRATVQPLSYVLEGFPGLAQPQWTAWRRRRRMEAIAPASFAQVVADIATFADPALESDQLDATWDPTKATWDERP